MAKLKPCPFCGGKAVIACLHKRFVRGLREFVSPVYVRCSVCGATSPVNWVVENSIEAWNRRADNADK